MPILKSILDNDLYKFTMQNAVLKYRQGVQVQYVFHNRPKIRYAEIGHPNEIKFNKEFYDAFHKELEAMQSLTMTNYELAWFKRKCPYLDDSYFAYLRDYRYNASEVSFNIHDGELELCIDGTWERTILWEVPLMALISELYFIHCDKSWYNDLKFHSLSFYSDQHSIKIRSLEKCFWADFGTRRRRSYLHQDAVVRASKGKLGFVGTSNVDFAYKYDVKPIGTMAHEWIMGISALEGLRHANHHALKIWSDIYRGNLGIGLTDTFGTDAFLKDFDSYYARLYDGVRHDSGDPIEFGEKIISHYRKLGINPLSKMIVFSDGLDSATASKIADHFRARIRTSFGIGTNFTNDYAYCGSSALNMVIKLNYCDGVPVVKLSDNISKSVGDLDAVRVAKWTFGMGEV